MFYPAAQLNNIIISLIILVLTMNLIRFKRVLPF